MTSALLIIPVPMYRLDRCNGVARRQLAFTHIVVRTASEKKDAGSGWSRAGFEMQSQGQTS